MDLSLNDIIGERKNIKLLSGVDEFDLEHIVFYLKDGIIECSIKLKGENFQRTVINDEEIRLIIYKEMI